MSEEKFNQYVEAIKEFDGVEEVFLLDGEGEIVRKSTDFSMTSEESKALLTAWKEKQPSLTFMGARFAILKNDEIQLAAKNIAGGKGNIAGSITKDGDYLVVHTSQDTGLILLEWSIQVNKIAWS